MTTKSALVTRLSFCRKRIMDGLKPSNSLRAGMSSQLPRNAQWRNQGQAPITDAQFSLNAILPYYKRPAALQRAHRGGCNPTQVMKIEGPFQAPQLRWYSSGLQTQTFNLTASSRLPPPRSTDGSTPAGTDTESTRPDRHTGRADKDWGHLDKGPRPGVPLLPG